MKKIVITLVIMLIAGSLGTIPAGRAEAVTSVTPPVGWSRDMLPRLMAPSPAGGVPVLVLQDVYPWNSSAHIDLLTSLGYAPVVATWSDLGATVQLKDFDNVYVASDQPQSFYNAYAAHAAELESWVKAGGHVFFSACTWGWAGGSLVTPLPGGAVSVNKAPAATNIVADTTHPIATGELSDGVPMTSPFTGNYASHSYFSVIPESADVIFRDSFMRPTLIAYKFGTGLVLGSGMTWEVGYLWNWQYALQSFDDALLFIFAKTVHTIDVPADVMAPVIELPDGVPQGGVGSPFSLHLIVTDDRSIADVSVYENGVRVGGSLTGGDIHLLLTLGNGRHNLVIVATDNAGHRTEQTIVLSVDTMPPALQVNALPSSVTSGALTVTGSAVDAVAGLAKLTINGEPVTAYLDGSFSEQLTLTKGVNTLVVEAADKIGNTTSQTFTVTWSAPVTGTPSSVYVVLTIDSADMEVNGFIRKLDAAPFIKDGRTLLPIRALIEALGGTVQWDAATKTATVVLGSRTVALTVGSTTALVNGTAVTLDVAPVIMKGRTFLPLRAVAENVGLDLAWEPVSRTVSFTYWP